MASRLINPAASGPAASRRAFTLVEMMVTIGVCAMLMGIGVAAFINMNRDLAWHSSVSTVTSLLHAARNSATSSRMPVSVIFVCDPEPAPEFRSPSGELYYVCTSLYATFAERIGAWHFEQPDGLLGGALIEGAFSQKATPSEMDDAELADGKYGKGVEFVRWESDGAECAPPAIIIGEALPAGGYRRLPAYDLREGLRISAWIKPELPPEDQADACFYPIVAKPLAEVADRSDLTRQPVYSLMLVLDAGERAFRLVGGVQAEDEGVTSLCEAVSAPMIAPRQWTHVALMYSAENAADGNFVRIFINDEEITATCGLEQQMIDGSSLSDADTEGRIARSSLPTLIGSDGLDSFHGVIDEVIFDAISTAERRSPRADVLYHFTNCDAGESGSGMYRIDFDRSGNLIQSAAGGLPLIELYSTGSPNATLIAVELTGSVRTWSATRQQIEDEAQDW